MRYPRRQQARIHLDFSMASNSPVILRFPERPAPEEDPIVITGIGIGSSLGSTRESVWQNIQLGTSRIRRTEANDNVGDLRLPCGMVDWLPPGSDSLKSIQLTQHAAAEALGDATIDWRTVDRTRFACSVSAQFGDIGYLYMPENERDTKPLNGLQASLVAGVLAFDSFACDRRAVSTLWSAIVSHNGVRERPDQYDCGGADDSR